MSALLYWLVIKPISLLPYWALYGFSDFFYLVIYHLVGYRKNVVRDNLSKSFPEKSLSEIKEIERKFYHHFCDLVLESLKNFSITRDQAQERMKQMDQEVFTRFYKEGRSVILTGGHYGNWELWAVATPEHFQHKLLAIYKRLSNAFFDQKMRSTRGRFGLELVPTKEYGNVIKDRENELTVSVFAIDQSPSNPQKCVWVDFLGRETAALYGAEKYAKMYNLPIVYGHVYKLSRGHYEVRYELVTENPGEFAHGQITQKLHDILAKDVLLAPEYWLWSHKRWKHKRPFEEKNQSEVSNK